MNEGHRGNIVLLGFMGTGKTTVGRMLAERLSMSFVDMDHLIEAKAGKAVSRIFAEDGEPHFRALERDLVKELSAKHGLVIGAGGGVVLNADNIKDYASSGQVVCLTAGPEVILKRLAGDSSRPLLEGEEKSARILKLLETRRSLYDAIPIKVDTSCRTPSEVVEVIESFTRTL